MESDEYFTAGKSIDIKGYGKVRLIKRMDLSGQAQAVFKTKDESRDLNLILKIYAPEEDSHWWRRLRRECEIGDVVDSRFVYPIKYTTLSEDKNYIFGLGLYYDGSTSLRQFLSTHGCPNERKKKEHYRDILNGVNYLHSIDVIHRDLKSDNILLGDSGAKIIDLGCAKRLDYGEDYDLPPDYALFAAYQCIPPEYVFERKSDQRADIFALGLLLYEICMGSHPYSGKINGHEDLVSFFSDDSNSLDDFVSDFNCNFIAHGAELLSSMLEFDPEVRVQSVDQILDRIENEYEDYSGDDDDDDDDDSDSSNTSCPRCHGSNVSVVDDEGIDWFCHTCDEYF